MTIDARAWVAGREPPAPFALAGRLALALGGGDPSTADVRVGATERIALACLGAAELPLARALGAAGSDRAVAVDLLVADALVTYAFEAMGDDPDRLPDVARRAMARLGRVASPP